jgi:hypothetical protein
MYIKNNSKNSWLQYDLGVCKIDILPEATFEVGDEIGELLLRRLGAPKWLTKTDKPEAKKSEVKEAPVKTVKKLFKK